MLYNHFSGLSLRNFRGFNVFVAMGQCNWRSLAGGGVSSSGPQAIASFA